jgi:fluoride exporter
MTGFALVFLGGGIGAALRHGANQLALALLGPGGFPLGTLAANLIGSIAIGVTAALLPEGQARLFVITGLLGGFTTFSAFSLETVALWQRGEIVGALAYVFGSVLLCVSGAAAGLALAGR